MNSRFFVILLTLVISSDLFSQSDFRYGYVLKQNGDTLFGQVNYQKDDQNRKNCVFKHFEIAPTVNYSPNMIKGYGILGEKQFISLHLNDSYVFAEYLVKGKTSLLYLNYKGEHFYLLCENETPIELKNNKTEDLNAKKVYENYKAYLQSKLQPGDYSQSIKDSKLEIKSLVSLISSYNLSMKYVYEIPDRPKGKSILKDYSILGTKRIQFGVLGGIAYNSFSAKVMSQGHKDADFYLSAANYQNQFNPLYGLFFKWNISRETPRLFLQTNVFYHAVNIHGSSAIKNIIYYETVNYDNFYFKFNELILQETFNVAVVSKPKFKVLPHAGFGITLRKNPSYIRYDDEFNTITKVVKLNEFHDIKILTNELAFLGGVTMDFKLSSARNVLLMLNYEIGSKLIDTKTDTWLKELDLRTSISGLKLSIGLTL